MRRNTALWVVQVLLAALFLFSGIMKFVMPVEVMAAQSHLPGWFFRFIGVCEILGGIGLIVPWLTRKAPRLTPIAAAGLVIIMIGATAISASGGVGVAAIPFVVGLLCMFVAYYRWKDAPQRASSRAVPAPTTV
ncbi:MAG: DoxX family protein [Thermoanaerobaculia bacterium]